MSQAPYQRGLRPPRMSGWWPKRPAFKLLIFLLVASAGLMATLFRGSPLSAIAKSQGLFGGAPFVTSDQSQVLIKGVDIEQTLIIAEREIQKGGFASVLTLWGIRDQIYTEGQAAEVSSLYFRHVGSMDDYFRIWHFTWAISNIYRNGNAAVRAQLEAAYQDATNRARAVGGFADAHVNGDILMGDIHLPARLFVRAHVVAPGTQGYLQSLEDYKP